MFIPPLFFWLLVGYIAVIIDNKVPNKRGVDLSDPSTLIKISLGVYYLWWVIMRTAIKKLVKWGLLRL